jgi:hypothetical protein
MPEPTQTPAFVRHHQPRRDLGVAQMVEDATQDLGLSTREATVGERMGCVEARGRDQHDRMLAPRER